MNRLLASIRASTIWFEREREKKKKPLWWFEAMSWRRLAVVAVVGGKDGRDRHLISRPEGTTIEFFCPTHSAPTERERDANGGLRRRGDACCLEAAFWSTIFLVRVLLQAEEGCVCLATCIDWSRSPACGFAVLVIPGRIIPVMNNSSLVFTWTFFL